MGIKTGTPGFDIEGSSYSYDVGDPNAPSEGLYPVPTDRGDVKVDKTVKDISKKTKTVLADYLGKQTSINNPAIYATPGQPPVDVSITGNNNTVPPIPSPTQTTSNADFFTKGIDTIGGSTGTSPQLKSWMRDEKPYVQPDPSRAGQRKGKEVARPGAQDGNSLLKNTELLKPYTQSVLNNNRWSTSMTFADANDENGNPTLNSPKYGNWTVDRMAQVGVALSIRASQEMGSANEGNNPTSGGQEAKALLPGVNQLGASRVSMNLLEASDVLRTMTDAEMPAGEFVKIADGSWGSLNNALDPYSGITAIGMIALSVALTLGVELAMQGLGILLSMAKNDPSPSKNHDGRYILGRSSVTKQADPNAFPPLPPDLGAMLGLRSTVHPFKEAVSKGIDIFMGKEAAGGVLGNAAASPGYVSIMSRTIIRSGVIIIASIKRAFAGGGGLVGTIKNILNIIDTIRSSKIIGAMNAFAVIGDAALTEDPNDVIEGRGEEPMRKSRTDRLEDIAGSAAYKSRMKTSEGAQSLKLAWASNRSPSLYLLPAAVDGLAIAGSSMGAHQTGLGAQEKLTRSLYKVTGVSSDSQNRIRHGSNIDNALDAKFHEQTLQQIETALDAEYVPFYFHDVRTNEVISFHAFLASLTDDFTANYDSIEGIGRVEPVKIYKSTHRKIGLSFYVAATSEPDFMDMWVKINKLVTLVYPQYTEGRHLTDNGQYSFVQPFSQMLGASPLIRLRLGNLFRSNYSRFALARLFGATLKGTKFGNGEFVTALEAASDGFNEQVQLQIESAKKTANESDLWYVTSDVPLQKNEAKSSSPPVPGTGADDNKDFAKEWNMQHDRQLLPVTISSVESDHVVVKVAKLDGLADYWSSLGYTSSQQSDLKQMLTSVYGNKGNQRQYVLGGTYKVNKDQLQPSKKLMKKFTDKVVGGAAGDKTGLDEFMNANNNAVVRSFRSAGGKGLAGFIESMNFDWYDKVTWDVDMGHKAPKLCKVTISFSPIHDITPGIDSQGYNRAPVYPVGWYTPSGEEKDEGQ